MEIAGILSRINKYSILFESKCLPDGLRTVKRALQQPTDSSEDPLLLWYMGLLLLRAPVDWGLSFINRVFARTPNLNNLYMETKTLLPVMRKRGSP